MNSKTKLLFLGFVVTFQLLTFNFQLVFALDTRTAAAVVDLEVKEGVPSGVVSTLSDYLRTQLVNTNKFVIVTRENMESILKEQQFQMTGCTSNECVVQIGQLLGVRKIFAGNIGKIGSTYIISLKIIDVQSGQIERAETERCEQCEEDALLASAENIAYKITSVPKPKKEEKGKGKGTLTIASLPSGADAYVNGEYKGKTPVTAEGNEGTNEIALNRQGYITVVKTVELKAGEEKELEVPLEQQQASLSIQIEPSGVKLFIDGEDKGFIEQKNLQYFLIIGKYSIAVEKENYLSYKKEIMVEYPKTELQIILDPKPGSLFVITTPDGAEIYIDGDYKGISPLTKEITSGTHMIKAVSKGFYEEQEVVIPPGGIKTVNLIIQVVEQKKTEVQIAGNFTSRIGLGLNYLGTQIKYGLNDSMLIEGKIQFGTQNTSVGGRLYLIIASIPSFVFILPYGGIEFSWIFSPYLLGGCATGGFLGAEFLITDNIGISADAGLYYLNVWSSMGSIGDFGIIFNTGLTYYF